MTESTDSCNENRYKSLFDSHAEPLRNFLYFKCGDAHLAADLMQEAFLRLWRDCQKVPVVKAKAYLYKVASNLFLDHVRHQQVVFKFKSQPTSSSTNETPEFEYEQEEFRLRLEAAINALPEDIRTTFLMNRIDQLTYREIAERLGVSVKAIEKRMSKALMSLRKLNSKI